MKTEQTPAPDLLQAIAGQAHAKRAIEVAAVTGMSITLIGPPGCGKTMLERAYRELAEPFTPDVVEAWPCPCGYLGDLAHACTCKPGTIARHHRRLDAAIKEYGCTVFIEVPSLNFRELRVPASAGEPLAVVRERVVRARGAAEKRESGEGMELDVDGSRLMDTCCDKWGLSARSVKGVITVARSIADLEANVCIRAAHLAEALQYHKRGSL